MAYRAGALYIASDVYDMVQKLFKYYVERIGGNTLIYTEHAKRKTITERDVRNGLASIGIKMLG